MTSPIEPTKNTQHTPGPWSVRSTETTFVVWAAEGIQVVSTSWHSRIRKPYPLRPEAEANARLIAAAPELLEECRFAAETFERYAELHRQKDTEDGYAKAAANAEAAKRIRAAILRAESR